MAILINRDTRIITVGITGKQGRFHSADCLSYGAQILGGVSPTKGGTTVDGLPVYATVAEAKDKLSPDVALIMVPAPLAADAILECIDAQIPLLVCITEGIPQFDMLKVNLALKNSATRLIGPNCPGLITPGECKIGIMPGHIHMPGPVGLISRSGTLTYETVDQLTKLGIGQSTCIGIGGDPIIGTTFVDLLKMFNDDDQTKLVVMVGEIGGVLEVDAARWIKANFNKPVVAYIAGVTAPKGKRMGHAGAVINGNQESAGFKMKFLEENGIFVAKTEAEIGILVQSVLKEKK